MTSNDAQIDVLLRRYAGQSQSTGDTEHLDADELTAFAEGSLPAAARARYVSHLVDCDNCRQIVSQLAISSGALVKTETETAAEVHSSSWWKRLSGFFSPLRLRYAAFAIVLIAAAGMIFLVTRRQRESGFLAQSEQREHLPESVVKPRGDTTPQAGSASQFGANGNKQGLAPPSSQPSPISDQIAKLDRPAAGDNPSAPSKSAREAEATSNPLPAAEKKAEPVVAQTAPSYAPPPPVEAKRAETPSEPQTIGGLASASGPRKSAPPADSFKMINRGRESEKDIRAGDDTSRVAVNQAPASRRASDEKAKGPRRDAENNVRNRNSNEVLTDAARTQSTVVPNRAASEEKPPETRTAGGRKFRRQGNAWVDTRFKSSMTVKSISRGSNDFDALDSGLRSIAQQLGGEVIVVWKGKAYLIR
jgi:hypothetical protein